MLYLNKTLIYNLNIELNKKFNDKEVFKMDVGKDAYKKMREIRKSKGLTQKFVADKLGFQSSQAYANIEYGNTELKLSVALQVATILGVSVYDFLGEKVKQIV